MEIAGYPHWETATSNILAHFMDPDAGHGLGTMVLESFLEAADMPYEGPVVVTDVQTEVPTAWKKRIDIVVEMDGCVIGIENKIHAPLVNDLEEYRRHLESVAPKWATSALYVLALKRPKNLRDVPFVGYGPFLDTLMQRLNAHSDETDSAQLCYLRDFVQTIRNLMRKPEMDTEFMTLMEEHSAAVATFLEKHTEMQNALRRELQAVAERLEPHPAWDQHFWRDPAKPRDVLVFTMPWSRETSLRVEARLSHRGWTSTVHAFGRPLSTPLDVILDRALPEWERRPWAENEDRIELLRKESDPDRAGDPTADLNEMLKALLVARPEGQAEGSP